MTGSPMPSGFTFDFLTICDSRIRACNNNHTKNCWNNKLRQLLVTAPPEAIGDENAICAPTRPDGGKERAMKHRRRFRHPIPLQDRLSAFVQAMRARAQLVPPGPERDELLKKAKKAEVAMRIEGWAKSSGLKSPK